MARKLEFEKIYQGFGMLNQKILGWVWFVVNITFGKLPLANIDSILKPCKLPSWAFLNNGG
jgi:hypothetical protein